jgi:hypothetical protein
VDVVLFFDCCYSFLATRAINAPGRVVGVLAAVDASSISANVPGQRVSFTGKLATKVAWLKGQGRQYVDLAELVTSLRDEDSPAKKPSHMLRIRLSLIRLRFPTSPASTQAAAPPSGPGLRAVFHVTVNKSFKSFSPDQLKSFLRWLEP